MIEGVEQAHFRFAHARGEQMQRTHLPIHIRLVRPRARGADEATSGN